MSSLLFFFFFFSYNTVTCTHTHTRARRRAAASLPMATLRARPVFSRWEWKLRMTMSEEKFSGIDNTTSCSDGLVTQIACPSRLVSSRCLVHPRMTSETTLYHSSLSERPFPGILLSTPRESNCDTHIRSSTRFHHHICKRDI